MNRSTSLSSRSIATGITVRAITSACVLALGLIFLSQAADAANKTWNNTGTDFNTAGSWTGGVPGTGDVALFNAAESSNPNLSSSLTIQELNFSGAAVSGYDLTSSSTAIKLTLTNTGTGATGAINATNTSGTNTIDAPIVMGAAAASTQTITDSAGGGNLTINGVISSLNSITLSLTMTGTSTITLAGANTYTGSTALAGGSINANTILAIGNDSAFSTGTVTLNSGIVLTAAGGSRSIGNAVVWNASGSIAGSNALSITGNFTSSGAAGRVITINNSALTTLSGNVYLAPDNTSAGGLTINGTGNLNISGVIANNSAANTLAKNLTINTTAGTTTLGNANTFTGSTTLSAGTISLGNKQAFGIGGTVAWNGVSTSASTDLSGANAIANSGTFGGTNIFTGTNNIELSGSLTEAASRTTTNNLTGGAALTYSGAFGISSGATNTNHNFNGTGNTFVTGVVSNGPTATASSLSETGSGTLTLSNTNTYAGNTSVSGGGTISVATIGNSGASGNLGQGTAINFGSTTTTGTLLYTGSGETTTKAINLAGGTGGGTIDQSGTGLLKFTANVTAPGANTTDERKTLTLQGSTAGTGEISGNIVDSTLGNVGQLATSVTKTGSGLWTLSGTNTYTGTTTVTSGTLAINGNNSSATGAVSVSGTLGGIGTIGGVTTVNSGGVIAPGNSIGTLSTNNQNVIISNGGTFSVELNGTSSDLLALGSGVLDLSASGDIISFTELGSLTGTSYTLVTYGSETGVFDTVTALPSGYSLVYNPTELDLVITAVPEPSTWLAGTLVALTLLASQRRRFLKTAAVRA